jgi:predicted DsbA family dithiol-disulfide isomerase
VRANPFPHLFGGSDPDDVLPIAYFSDFYCPYCRVLERDLSKVLSEDPALRLVQHELPLLGGASVSAAKAVLAADLQGGYSDMKARLLRTGLITDEAYLRAVAPDLGLDADRLLHDMESPEIADRLLTSRALGKVFGIVGTPALVIGRTLVMGAVTNRTIERVVSDERALGALHSGS